MSGTPSTKPVATKRPRRRHPLRNLLILLAILAALGGAVWGYVEFWLTQPVGSGPAGPTVAAEAFADAWTARPVVLLGVGDSITAGFGATSGHSYFDRLAANPPDEFEDMRGRSLSAVMPRLEARNTAVSGSNSLQHMGYLDRLAPYGPDVLGIVVISTGGNDIIHSYGRNPPQEGAMCGATLAQARPWIESFERRLDEMTAKVRGLFPGGCQIFLANIYDFTDGGGDIESAVPPFVDVEVPDWPDGMAILDAYNDAIARCAARHADVHLVDIHAAFLGHGIHCRKFWRKTYRPEDPHYWHHANFEDPNDRGYDAIRRLFLLEMARVMAPKRQEQR